MKFVLKEILSKVSYKKISNKGIKEFIIDNVHFDSRKIDRNGMFIALSNGNTDGHRYVKLAKEKGAIVAVVEKVTEEMKQLKMHYILVKSSEKFLQELASSYRVILNKPVIGITGSNGKTTTKDLVAGLLSKKLKVHKTQGNYNNHLGLPLTILQADRDVDLLVLEMGMNHAGEIDLLANIAKPNYGIITNIGESHIEYLGSKEGIAHAKGEMLVHIQKGGKVYIPIECNFKDLLASKTTETKVYFGIGKSEDNPFFDPSKMDWDLDEKIIAHTIDIWEGYTTFEYGYSSGGMVERYWMPIYGEHNVCNALPAIDIAKQLGFTNLEILEGLKEISVTPMRFEKVIGKNDVIIINDAYNASPTSMMKSSKTFLDIFKEKHRVLVLGDMYELGENTDIFHREVGEKLNSMKKEISILITVGEHAKLISATFEGRKLHFDAKEEAKKYVEVFCSKDFALFFKASRGMKLEEIVNQIKK